jgi:hypothetical protein
LASQDSLTLRIFAVSAGVKVSIAGAAVEDIVVLLSCTIGCNVVRLLDARQQPQFNKKEISEGEDAAGAFSQKLE